MVALVEAFKLYLNPHPEHCGSFPLQLWSILGQSGNLSRITARDKEGVGVKVLRAWQLEPGKLGKER
jgi:hypothetical protein